MSLDVYIKSKKKEEDRKWVANITHNMNKMAQKNIRIRKQRNTMRLCLETGRIGQGNKY